MIPMSNSDGPDMQRVTNLETLWEARLARVRGSQARTDPTGMTRPPRDPDERAFLTRIGQLGPFTEAQSSSSSPELSTSQRSDTV